MNEQESFWAGEFGDAYTERNQGAHWISANLALFSKVLGSAPGVGSVLEFGANRGLNLIALRQLLPSASLSAVEINSRASEDLRSALPDARVAVGSILDADMPGQFDLVFTKGVLIHCNPETLPAVYARMVNASRRYVMVAEYYSPAPTVIPYRGHADRLFKRDFAGEMLDAFPALRLRDYGFAYRRDPTFPQDDLNWFLLEKV